MSYVKECFYSCLRLTLSWKWNNCKRVNPFFLLLSLLKPANIITWNNLFSMQCMCRVCHETIFFHFALMGIHLYVCPKFLFIFKSAEYFFVVTYTRSTCSTITEMVYRGGCWNAFCVYVVAYSWSDLILWLFRYF